MRNVIGSKRSRAGDDGYLGVGSRFPDTVKTPGRFSGAEGTL